MKDFSLLFFLIFTLVSCNISDSVQGQNEAAYSILRLASGDPQSLDPRLARDIVSVSTLHMLYEGLMRPDFHGKLVPALAERVDVSDDLKTYMFKLRKSSWSNGDLVTADDFVHSWRSILDPKFAAPNAYQLYVIKGAKAAKEGKIPVEQIRVYAFDPETLVVELEYPVPYFLELTAFHPFFPIYSKSEKKEERLISNGPYQLEKWQRNNELLFSKNPYYWDAESVNLDQISIAVVNEHTALQLFEAGQLDWVGSPLSVIPPDAVGALKQEGRLESAQAAGTHLLRINTKSSPLNHAKLRKALSLALDRKALVEHVLQGGQTPGFGLVPQFMGLQTAVNLSNDNEMAAKELFQEALVEIGITEKELPEITLSYTINERNQKVAQTLQQQWQQVLGIKVNLENCEGKVFFDKIARVDYQLSLGSWYGDFRDPINFLEVFKYKDNGTNNTLWENLKYIELLGLSSIEAIPEKRKQLLSEAEKILMDEMPVIPLFYGCYNYMSKENLKGVYFSELGYLDLKHAFFDHE